jgi:hypothetical protein
MSIRTRLISAAAALMLGAAGALVWAPPAHADTVECRTNSKKFSLPRKPDLYFDINLCVIRETGGRVRAYTTMRWYPTSNLPMGTRFNDFVIKLRLERYDRIKKSRSYDILVPINTERRGYRNYSGGVSIPEPARGGWSADGVIVYDIHGDGLGNFVWNLSGSPVIS